MPASLSVLPTLDDLELALTERDHYDLFDGLRRDREGNVTQTDRRILRSREKKLLEAHWAEMLSIDERAFAFSVSHYIIYLGVANVLAPDGDPVGIQ